MSEGKFEIEAFSKIAAGLAILRSRHEGVVVDVSTKEGLKSAKASRDELRDYRLNLEATRKAEKESILNRGRLIDSEAKRIQSVLTPWEESYAKTIKEHEDEQQRLKDAKLAEEGRRVRALQDRVESIHAVWRSRVGASIESVEAGIALVNSFAIDDSFAEMLPAAQAAHQEAIDKLAAMLQQAKDQKELADLRERQRVDEENRQAEQKRVAAIRTRIDQIKAAPALCIGLDSKRIKLALDRLVAVSIDGFEEFSDEGAEEVKSSLASLRNLLGEAVKNEVNALALKRLQDEEDARNKAANDEKAKAEREAAKKKREEVEAQEALAVAEAAEKLRKDAVLREASAAMLKALESVLNSPAWWSIDEATKAEVIAAVTLATGTTPIPFHNIKECHE